MKVSKKKSKKAVVRNKIKRRIRHLINTTFNKSNQFKNDLAIMFIPHKGFESVKFAELEHALQKLIAKIPN